MATPSPEGARAVRYDAASLEALPLESITAAEVPKADVLWIDVDVERAPDFVIGRMLPHETSASSSVAPHQLCLSVGSTWVISAHRGGGDFFMKVLTIISTIFLPISFIAGLYGMNFDTGHPANMPELHWAYGYPFALGLMVLVVAFMLNLFRRRGWLGTAAGAEYLAASEEPDAEQK